MHEGNSGGEAQKGDAKAREGASESYKEIEQRAEQTFGLPLLVENGWDPELIQSMMERCSAAAEELDSDSLSEPWHTRAHDATVVVETGQDIARRYANRKLRPGFKANHVVLDFRWLTLKLLTTPASLEALEPENAIWRAKVFDWANRCAGYFAIPGASKLLKLPKSLLTSCGVKPFLDPKMARFLVIAWTALGGELLMDFLKEIVKRGLENRDPAGILRRKILVCQAAAGGARTAAEIRDRIEPFLQVQKDPALVAPDDRSAKLSAQARDEAKKIRSGDVIQKSVQRMRKNPGKIRGKANAENFGFGAFVDGQYLA